MLCFSRSSLLRWAMMSHFGQTSASESALSAPHSGRQDQHIHSARSIALRPCRSNKRSRMPCSGPAFRHRVHGGQFTHCASAARQPNALRFQHEAPRCSHSSIKVSPGICGRLRPSSWHARADGIVDSRYRTATSTPASRVAVPAAQTSDGTGRRRDAPDAVDRLLRPAPGQKALLWCCVRVDGCVSRPANTRNGTDALERSRSSMRRCYRHLTHRASTAQSPCLNSALIAGIQRLRGTRDAAPGGCGTDDTASCHGELAKRALQAERMPTSGNMPARRRAMELLFSVLTLLGGARAAPGTGCGSARGAPRLGHDIQSNVPESSGGRAAQDTTAADNNAWPGQGRRRVRGMVVGMKRQRVFGL